MTTIIIKKNENGEYKGFSCKGHSGFARSGKDIVCAAASILVINTINSMEELTKEDMDVSTDEESGFIGCIFKKDLSEKGKLLMDSMILGLSSVEKQYGKKYLSLKFEEV
ncbi:MAG: ribosomal-processing cysteine protease Prp [Clostridiales bacterium]|nr:ribosomal-processing cysteine protease Prp [Clostridiales bacterium]